MCLPRMSRLNCLYLDSTSYWLTLKIAKAVPKTSIPVWIPCLETPTLRKSPQLTSCVHAHSLMAQNDFSSRKRSWQQNYKSARADPGETKKVERTSPWTWDINPFLSNEPVFLEGVKTQSCAQKQYVDNGCSMDLKERLRSILGHIKNLSLVWCHETRLRIVSQLGVRVSCIWAHFFLVVGHDGAMII